MRSLILIVGLLVAGCTSTGLRCNPETDVCDFPSRAEIQSRANQVPVVSQERRDLGTAYVKPAERLLEAQGSVNYSCVEHMETVRRGNFNASLCMPDWMRNVPPSALLHFRRWQSQMQRVIYLITNADIRRYYWYRY